LRHRIASSIPGRQIWAASASFFARSKGGVALLNRLGLPQRLPLASLSLRHIGDSDGASAGGESV